VLVAGNLDLAESSFATMFDVVPKGWSLGPDAPKGPAALGKMECTVAGCSGT